LGRRFQKIAITDEAIDAISHVFTYKARHVDKPDLDINIRALQPLQVTAASCRACLTLALKKLTLTKETFCSDILW